MKYVKHGKENRENESLPAWGVWIEIEMNKEQLAEYASLPAWGVWIEINERETRRSDLSVTPRMGSVN